MSDNIAKITMERTYDLELVRVIMTDPKIWPKLSDDGSPPPDQWQPPDHPDVWHVVGRYRFEPMAAWILTPHNNICYEIHTAILPWAWGPLAHDAAKKLVQWIWINTPCERLITNVPVINRLALRFALQAGMTEYGRNPRSFRKGGQLLDQILLGMSKPEDLCPQQ